MEYFAPATQTAVITYGVFKIAKMTYSRLFGHRDALISQAQRMIESVSSEMEYGMDLEIDEVTDAVPQTVMDSVDTKTTQKRRVRRKAPFRAWLVKVGKAKFGLPNRTEANRMCVRKYLYDQCVDHGVLARHIWENVDFATEMVFIPSKVELVVAASKHTQHAKSKGSMMASFGVPTPKSA
jgi:hypothetical protein